LGKQLNPRTINHDKITLPVAVQIVKSGAAKPGAST
ncbi:MAG: hypothetical protein ACJAXZ_003983, partial [Akkermansiaceae bacterium]